MVPSIVVGKHGAHAHESMTGRSPSKAISIKSGSAVGYGKTSGSIPRNGSAPQFNHGRSIPKNGSVPLFDRMARKHSFKAVPLGSAQNRPRFVFNKNLCWVKRCVNSLS